MSGPSLTATAHYQLLYHCQFASPLHFGSLANQRASDPRRRIAEKWQALPPRGFHATLGKFHHISGRIRRPAEAAFRWIQWCWGRLARLLLALVPRREPVD